MFASPHPSHTSFITADSGFFCTRRETKKQKRLAWQKPKVSDRKETPQHGQSASAFPGWRFSKEAPRAVNPGDPQLRLNNVPLRGQIPLRQKPSRPSRPSFQAFHVWLWAILLLVVSPVVNPSQQPAMVWWTQRGSSVISGLQQGQPVETCLLGLDELGILRRS